MEKLTMEANKPLQRYAFIHFNEHIAKEVAELYEKDYPYFDDVKHPNTIRIDVVKMNYVLARTTNSGFQRPFLDSSVIHFFPMIPTPEARQLLLEDLYADLGRSEG